MTPPYRAPRIYLLVLLLAPVRLSAQTSSDATPVVLFSAYPDCSQLENKVKALEKRSAEYRRTITRLKQQLKQTARLTAQQKKEMADQQRKIQEQAAQIEELQRQVDALELTSAALRQENLQLRMSNDYLSVALVAREAEFKQSAGKQAALEERIRQLEQDVRQLQQEKMELENETARLQEEVSRLRSVAAVTAAAPAVSPGPQVPARPPFPSPAPESGQIGTPPRSTASEAPATEYTAVQVAALTQPSTTVAGGPERAVPLPALRLAAGRLSSRTGAAGATTDVYRLVAEGEKLLEEGLVEQAHQQFQRALDQNPDLVQARLGLAACYYAYGAFTEAANAAAEVVRRDPHHPMGLALSALIAWQRGELARAQDFITRAVKEDATDPRIQNYAGIVFHANGDYERARECFQRAVDLDPGYGEAYFNLAVLLADQFNDLDGARRAYQQARTAGAEPDPWLESKLNAAASSPLAE